VPEVAIISGDRVFAAMLVRLCAEAGASAEIVAPGGAVPDGAVVAVRDAGYPCRVPDGVRVISLAFDGECDLKRPFLTDDFVSLIKTAMNGSNDDAFVFDDKTRTVARNLRRAELTELEYALAKKLYDAGGAPVSRADLLSDVWSGGVESDGIVGVYVCYVRKKFEEAFGDGCIRTVREKGYIWKPKLI
jgi:hypothetical protein